MHSFEYVIVSIATANAQGFIWQMLRANTFCVIVDVVMFYVRRGFFNIYGGSLQLRHIVKCL